MSYLLGYIKQTSELFVCYSLGCYQKQARKYNNTQNIIAVNLAELIIALNYNCWMEIKLFKTFQFVGFLLGVYLHVQWHSYWYCAWVLLTCSFSTMSAFRNTFMAYTWPVSTFWTSTTSPNAPRPIIFNRLKSLYPKRERLNLRNWVSFWACCLHRSSCYGTNKLICATRLNGFSTNRCGKT